LTLSLVQKQSPEKAFARKKKEEEGLKISNVPKEELDSCRFVQHEPVNCSDPSKAKVKLAQLENILLNPSLAKDRASNGTEVYRSRRRCNLQTHLLALALLACPVHRLQKEKPENLRTSQKRKA